MKVRMLEELVSRIDGKPVPGGRAEAAEALGLGRVLAQGSVAGAGGSRAFCEGDSVREQHVTLHGGVRAPQKQAAPVLTMPGACPDLGDSVVVCGCPWHSVPCL